MTLHLKSNVSGIISLIVISRILILPIFFLLILYEYKIPALLLLLVVLSTDYLDGYLVKKLNLKPMFSFYLDPVSDFIFILISFYAFVIKGIYPLSVLFIILLMFIQFVLSSGFRNPIYDPVGKYYGIFLFLIIGITILLEKYYDLIIVGIIIFSIISVSSRIVFFSNIKKLNK
ncbi:MAG: hypothetical protein APG12_01512 [Candidatus Methanofastidiosum methylothiophilum]|uniref:CDP-alcohol phosphatidyltransferase family protein n=1 Tax=Candidatus Methanofastidiosum methylothiophilum TaxID=1705564 RepID=A0A150IK21_9EURY|nr:MAG: hypothetical protein APG10_01264 [Candidatus Methanofastidiosum methylthiophilus]KYC47796.1 MAG: hypothetical protein APG11_00874 [Candidatus Methanofastidiosum methylthiophilus]KYC49424.1 MAG: hypothetical protein APG12_01512 [Candidatus Methanofastidiosum methylthiophilus]